MLTGRRIWVVVNEYERPNPETGGTWKHAANIYDCRVLSFRKFLPRGPIRDDSGAIVNERKQSLVQLYTDPGGIRTLAVASIRFNDPRRAKL